MRPSREGISREISDRRDFPPAAKRMRIIFENLDRRKCTSILDGGCGTGWVSLFLQDAGLKTVMLDASRQMLRKCLALKSGSALSSPFVRATVTELPFEDRAFDLCVLLDVIEHVPKVSLCLKEVNRVLTDEGKLFMTVPNKFGTYTVIYDFLGARMFGKRISDHLHYFSIQNLKEMLVDNGFMIEKIENIEFVSPILHMLSRNLKHGKELICRLSRMDVSLSDHLPKQVVSEWFIVASIKKRP